MSGFLEEVFTFSVAPPPYTGPVVASHPVVVEETIELSSEQGRLNKYVAAANSSRQVPEYQPPPKKPQGKQESWVDLHNEYGDILDAQELAKYRRHFRAFGASDSG
eukprot:TRINITY_DN5452_c0_g1_i2.p2 TRINITY_DN5452_c0_g1~~TRINITY_DN5452_c0_g1_i2.p2  ORF type:complete len:106 (-),score=25.32 TRINITY_DN5452_c0_g1_i2:382-699(-)